MELISQVPQSEYSAVEYYNILELISNRYLKLSHSLYYQSNSDIEKKLLFLYPEVQRSKYGICIRKFLGDNLLLQDGKRAPLFVVRDWEVNGYVLRI